MSSGLIRRASVLAALVGCTAALAGCGVRQAASPGKAVSSGKAGQPISSAAGTAIQSSEAAIPWAGRTAPTQPA